MASPTVQAGSADAEAATTDVFHRGAFVLVQPLSGGHRAGMDAMMLAAAVPSTFAGSLADLGAGAGAAGLAVAARCPGARVTLVENAARMAGFARLTLAHPANRALAPRCTLVEADVTLSGRARQAAGLADGGFDFAVMNPPFNAAADRPSPDPLRRDAHVMADGLFEAWLRTAAALVKPRGGFAAIVRPQSIAPLLAAMERRFGGAEIVPVHPRAEQPAIRIVVRARRASRAGLSLMPPLVLHGGAGHGFTERADDINNGRASLFGD